MIKLPEFKKKVNSFLTKEDGKISKESIIKSGVLIAALSLGAAIATKTASSAITCDPNCEELSNPTSYKDHSQSGLTDHNNNMNITSEGSNAIGAHNHCAQECHTSHDSHGSHCDCAVWDN
jgi:hypothetical protein